MKKMYGIISYLCGAGEKRCSIEDFVFVLTKNIKSIIFTHYYAFVYFSN